MSVADATMIVRRFAAFADADEGGNPAGVVLCAEELPSASTMQRVAAEVGYSETAFAAPDGRGWRVRYFAPEIEIPFCGHATIALGAALARSHGEGRFALTLNDGEISVEAWREDGALVAALQSPPTRSAPAPGPLLTDALACFGYARDDLDARLPPALIEAGARHLLLALATRESLSRLQYDLATGRALMLGAGLATVTLAYAEEARRFRVRNPFAAGGVYEDPATGAAAAATSGYLRDVGWPHGGGIELRQGVEMGMPSLLRTTIPAEPGSSIRVSGRVRALD